MEPFALHLISFKFSHREMKKEPYRQIIPRQFEGQEMSCSLGMSYPFGEELCDSVWIQLPPIKNNLPIPCDCSWTILARNHILSVFNAFLYFKGYFNVVFITAAVVTWKGTWMNA